jgi:2-polyprenyl-3-methyl-5-hydroxy-6-metoxy-1,4-benzoquinol methylase
MLDLIGHSKRVLECGCATGYMSRVLAERGCRVTGVEIDPAAAEQARAFCERVVVGDLDEIDLVEVLGVPGEPGSCALPFDVVVFGDVLEHLKDPLRVLRASRGLLAPDGYVVASIPNVAHGDVRLSLLAGAFPYRPLGLLDDTHIRFFTRESIDELFDDAGFVVSEVERVEVDLFGTELGVCPEAFSSEIVERVASDPEARTYQFVVRGLIDNGLDVVRRLAARHEARELELRATERELSAQRTQSVALEQDRDRWQAEAQAAQAEARRWQTTAENLEVARDQLAYRDDHRQREAEALRHSLSDLQVRLREAEQELERLRAERDQWAAGQQAPGAGQAYEAYGAPGVSGEEAAPRPASRTARVARTVWGHTPEAAKRVAGPVLRPIRKFRG